MLSTIRHIPRSGLAYNIGWGLAYILGAWIGLELAVPPSSISPIWPAAGVALAALLVQGNRVLPGLFIGCYLVQLAAFSDFSSRPAILQSLLVALIASIGSILQAWTGQFLIRRRLGWPLGLARAREILMFFLLAALLACMIAPTIGVASLYAAGAFSADLAPQVWLTWWVGDSLGVLITTPMILAFAGQPTDHWKPRRLTLGLPLLATLLLIVLFFDFTLDQLPLATAVEADAAGQHGWSLWAMLVIGFSFSALLGIALLALTGQKALISAQVKRRTRELANEIAEHQRTEKVLELHSQVLEMIATNTPLQETLDFICRGFEALSRPGTFASVMLVDTRHKLLRLTAGPSIPRPVIDALLEFPIGEREGSCGTAVFRGEQVFACDIEHDDVWEKYREFALDNGLRACWSMPFRAPSGEVLGSFALTQTEVRSPLPIDRTHLRVAGNLCALAVERAHNNEHLNKLSLAVEQNPGAIAITDTGGHIEYINVRFSEMTGYRLQEIEGRVLSDLLRSVEETRDNDAPWSDLSDGGSWHMKTRYQRKDGTSYWAECHAAPVRDAQGRVTHVVATHEDVTQLHTASEKLAHQATHDQLTGLINRIEFERRLEALRERAIRDDETHTLCFIDMDRFKAVNDSCGHIGGDELLRQVTRLMSDTVRKHDVLARVGGDEFAILFEYCDEAQAHRNLDKLRELIAEYRFVWNEKSFHVGISGGLVEINALSPSAEELLREADSACYEAKQHGRNQVQVYHPGVADPQQQSHEIEYINELREALADGRLQLYQQRIQALQPGVPDNAEILIRLQRSDGSLLGPGQFLPAAERFGLARTVDNWVVEQTFRHLAGYPAYLERLGYCSINLSGLSLSEDLADHVIERLDRHGIPGESICFEITETAAIANLSQAQLFMRKLQKRGIRFALDDFGSGLSSFGYLKSLPVDILKIDGQFVRDMLDDLSDLAIVRSIAELGQALKRPTVAEFVERQEMVGVLKGLGIDYAQGYSIGMPEPLLAPPAAHHQA